VFQEDLIDAVWTMEVQPGLQKETAIPTVTWERSQGSYSLLVVLLFWYQSRILADRNSSRRPTQGSFPLQAGIIWMHAYAIWIEEWPACFPKTHWLPE
jgi:hypothetical protein